MPTHIQPSCLPLRCALQSFTYLRRSVERGLGNQVVSRTPFMEPNIKLVFQGPSKGSSEPARLQLSVRHLHACVSTCTMVTLQALIKSLNQVRCCC